MSKETPPNREEERENPNQMWGHLGKKIPFRGHVAEAEVPKLYTMEIASGFVDDAEDGTIDIQKWEQWFREKDNGVNKDETYYKKVIEAIKKWNNLPKEERIKFLTTGEQSDNISNDMISLLSSGRIIDIAHKKSLPPTPPPPPGRRKRPPIYSDPTPRHKWILPWHRKKRSISHDPDFDPTDNIDPDPDRPEPNPGFIPDPTDDDVTESPKPKPNKPESNHDEPDPDEPEPNPQRPENQETEEEKTYPIIKDIRLVELPPEEQREIEKIVSENIERLKNLAKNGAVLILALLLLIPPYDKRPGNDAAAITATGFSTTEEYHPPHEIERKMTAEEREQARIKYIEELLSDKRLGDTVEIPSGVTLHSSSDWELVKKQGGKDYTVTIGESPYRAEGEYTIDRVSFLGEDGRIIASFHLENGDSGNLGDLLKRARQETSYTGEITVALHFDGPNGGGDLQGQTGWSHGDGFASPTGTITEVIPGYTTEKTITKKYSGESEDISNGNIEITNDEGETVTINVLNQDGTYRNVGDTVIGSDGKAYKIESIDIQDGGTVKKINFLKLAHDITMIGIAATGVALALRRKKEGEPSDETEDTEETETTETTRTTPEYESERIMMELNGEQLLRLVRIFSEKAGDEAMQIAQELAEKANIPIAEENDEDEEEESLFDGMTQAEKTIAQALLIKHDEATLRVLSELLDIDLEEYASQILGDTPLDEHNNESEDE